MAGMFRFKLDVYVFQTISSFPSCADALVSPLVAFKPIAVVYRCQGHLGGASGHGGG